MIVCLSIRLSFILLLLYSRKKWMNDSEQRISLEIFWWVVAINRNLPWFIVSQYRANRFLMIVFKKKNTYFPFVFNCFQIVVMLLNKCKYKWKKNIMCLSNHNIYSSSGFQWYPVVDIIRLYFLSFHFIQSFLLCLAFFYINSTEQF